jgi:hypothetical protein
MEIENLTFEECSAREERQEDPLGAELIERFLGGLGERLD